VLKIVLLIIYQLKFMWFSDLPGAWLSPLLEASRKDLREEVSKHTCSFYFSASPEESWLLASSIQFQGL
jgi:hypothetical protein